jgi:hypothetical protein
MADLMHLETDLDGRTDRWRVRWLVEVFVETDDGHEELADALTILQAHTPMGMDGWRDRRWPASH